MRKKYISSNLTCFIATPVHQPFRPWEASHSLFLRSCLPIKKSLNVARIVNQTGLLSSDPLWLDHLIHRDDAIRSQESQNTVKFTHGKTMVKWQLADILVVVNDGKSFELFTLDLETRFQPLSSKNTTKEKRKMVEECRTIYSPPGSCQHDSSPPHKFKVQTIHHS